MKRWAMSVVLVLVVAASCIAAVGQGTPQVISSTDPGLTTLVAQLKVEVQELTVQVQALQKYMQELRKQTSSAIFLTGSLPMVGSTTEEIRRLLGEPNTTYKSLYSENEVTWFYPTYSITFQNNHAVRWERRSDKPNIASPQLTLPTTTPVSPGIAENDSYYGEISEATGKPKTTYVHGYFRKDGTYVRSHYRSK